MTGPLAAPTTAAPPTSSSSSSSSSSRKPLKGAAAAKGPTKATAQSPSSTSADTKPDPAKFAVASGLHKGPIALKPSTRKPAPLPQQPQQPTTQHSPPPPVDVMAMSAVVSPAPALEAPTMSMTSKEWVIPPRPKPGRKPATDTPPTKRKAQNRAAQRAFRERRAARVGELEELLDQQKSEQDQREQNQKDTIRDLELEVQSFRSRCLLLENMLERERKERLQAETQLETLRRQSEDRPLFRTGSLPEPPPQPAQMTASSQPHPRPSFSSSATHERHGSNTLPPITTTNSSDSLPAQGYLAADAPLTCGNCEPTTGRCACVEEVLNASCGKCGLGNTCQCLEDVSNLSQGQDLKRSVSPSAASSTQKRFRPGGAGAEEPTEVDFTRFFSRRPTIETDQASDFQTPQTVPAPPSLDTAFMKDDCGFCKDGTYCVCADTAMATPALTPIDTLPPISSQTRTPPPSETDVGSNPFIMEMTAEGAVKLPRRSQASKRPTPTPAPKGCGGGGPGTCEQCRSDPKSGLFCRLMAANFSKGEGGGCCGGKGADGGCCKSKKPAAAPPAPAVAAPKEKITLPSLPSLGLSCAEAYQTLASHRNFDRAADDIGSWLPMLKATPRAGKAGGVRPGPAPPQGGRMMPIEVEAASIMSVLKDFDVRFGREA